MYIVHFLFNLILQMNSVCWILFVVIILSTWRDSLGQGDCELNYSLIQSKEGEYRRFIDELNGTLIDPEELVIEDDFNLIHFQYTVDLSRRIFDEQLAKLRGEIRKDQREIPHFEETIGGVTETKSKCSAVCGEGVRHVTEITCENGRNLDNCTQPKFVTRLEPCFPIFGCPTVAFGEWGGWSSCSQSCIESLNDIPYRVRVRTCTPNCQFGNIEKRPCDLPMCPPTCPEYTATLDRNTKDDLKISVLFTIDPPKRTIGQNSRQEVSLRDFYDGSLVETFNVTYHKTIQKTSLRINSAYVPEIRIINEIFLRSPHSNPTSLLVHHCQGRVLHCNFFICDDGTRILADELCNNKVNCPDLSDERADRCTGSFGIPLITLTLFLFVYIIIGVGLFLSRNKEEFFMKDEPSKTPQELELLRHEYANLHINKSTEEFLHLYANDRQVLLEVVRPMELEAHEQVVYKALECLKDSHVIAGGNMIIMGSFSGKIKAI
uniref:Brainspecific angiogenesis inhibitor 1like [Xiphosphorus maculatus] n=1 Tax=Lepeophtheirus salmonis TaxID=72036 RepID=A0A0K2TTW6_LEPSM